MSRVTYYDNKRFRITADDNNGVLGLDIESGYCATQAVVYDDNTIGCDNPGILNKAIRRAINIIVTKRTGKPALVNINIMNEKKTYREYYNL